MTDAASVRSGPWPAPAKLNLFLHILGRRSDGYHRLQTVFQFLDHGDRLWFTPRSDGRIRLLTPIPGVAETGNLVWRAARALQERAPEGAGVDIELDKRLPAGGGLGGGSSDAATTLYALQRLWELDLEPDELAAIGLTLGADVPVFVAGHAAWAEGIGERLTPVTLPEDWFLVVQPDCQVSTAAIFSDPQLTRDTPPTTITAFLQGQVQNDCEPVVRRRYPEVGRALDLLGRLAPARLTGTGACVFAAFPQRQPAEAALESVRQEGLEGFVARGCNRSPLLRDATAL